MIALILKVILIIVSGVILLPIFLWFVGWCMCYMQIMLENKAKENDK
jgi:hypothetical protein